MASTAAKARPAPEEGPFRLVDLKKVKVGDNPRREVSDSGLKDLAASVRKHGVLEPLIVRPSNGHFVVVAGKRRFLAAKKANLAKVPVLVHPEYTDTTAFIASIVENLQREDLSAVDEAFAFKLVLASDKKLTQEELGKRLGKSQSYIANKLRLLELEPDLLGDIAKGRLTEAAGKALVSLPREERRRVLEEHKQTGQNSRALEQRVAQEKHRFDQHEKFVADSAVRKAAVIERIKKEVKKGRKVIVEADEKDLWYLKKSEVPKGAYVTGARSSIPTTYQLRFDACQKCPVLKPGKDGEFKIQKALLVSRNFEVVEACGFPEHYEFLGKQRTKDAADGRKATTDEVDRLRKESGKAVTGEMGTRLVFYMLMRIGSDWNVSPSGAAFIRRIEKKKSGKDAEPTPKQYLFDDLWRAIEAAEMAEIQDTMREMIARDLIQSPEQGGRHAAARDSLIKAANLETKMYAKKEKA